jgi:hypothetical protein
MAEGIFFGKRSWGGARGREHQVLRAISWEI